VDPLSILSSQQKTKEIIIISTIVGSCNLGGTGEDDRQSKIHYREKLIA
jgi:hypothetical protein